MTRQFRLVHLSGWWWSILLSIAISVIAFKALMTPHGGHSSNGTGWLFVIAAVSFGIQAGLITPWLLLQAEQYGVKKSFSLFWPLVLALASLLVVIVCWIST